MERARLAARRAPFQASVPACYRARVRRGAGIASGLVLLVLASGFDWPGGPMRLVSALTRGAEPEAPPPDDAELVRALDDDSLEVRRQAAEVLGARDTPRARAALRAAADDPLPERRVVVLDHVTGGDDATARVLLRALGDRDEEVVLAGLRGLVRSGRAIPDAQLDLLADAPDPRIAAAVVRARARQQPETRTPWPPLAALTALARTAEPGLPAVEAARLLEELERTVAPGESLATAPLVLWLAHAPEALHARILALVERAGGSVDGRLLAPLLAEGEAARRALVARLLGRAPVDDARAPLLAALDDESERVREAATESLAMQLDGAIVDALRAQLEETGARRQAALRVLADGLEGRAEGLDAARREALVAPLRRLLTGDDEAQVALAARGLGALETDAARAAVRALANDPRPLRRIAALRASVRDPEARALRSELAASHDPRIAATALTAAALAGDVLPVGWLLAHRRDAPWPVGPAIAFALASAPTPLLARVSCAGADAHEPATLANLLAARARGASVPCLALRAGSALAHGASFPVRHAAARALRADEARGDRTQAPAALARCSRRDVDARLRATCVGMALAAIAPARSDAPRALVIGDGRVIVSWPDGSERVTWPRVAVVADTSAWLARDDE